MKNVLTGKDSVPVVPSVEFTKRLINQKCVYAFYARSTVDIVLGFLKLLLSVMLARVCAYVHE